MSEQLYTIGQTAKIGMTSVQTLRFYDKIGLIRPTAVDEQSGYRFYSNRDILQIKIVQDMRSLQFSLKEIAELLQGDLTELIPLRMRKKKEEALSSIASLQASVAMIDKRLEQMEVQQELRREFVNNDVYVEMKYCDARLIAFDRKRSACGMEPFIERFTEMLNRIGQHGLEHNGGYLMVVYHEDLMRFDREDSDIEIVVPLSGTIEPLPWIRTIPGGDYLTATFCGIPAEEMYKRYYTQLLEWMNQNGYEKDGLVIEQFVIDFAQIGTPEDFMIELQIPVKKVLTL